jgi:hypothetical protein
MRFQIQDSRRIQEGIVAENKFHNIIAVTGRREVQYNACGEAAKILPI